VIQFRVELRGRASLRLPKRLDLRRQDSRVVHVYDWISSADEGEPVEHRGLHYVIDVAAADIEAAIVEAEGMCPGMVDLLSFASSAAIEAPRPFIAYDLDPTTTERQFAQVFFDVPVRLRPRRMLSVEDFMSLLNNWNPNWQTAQEDRAGMSRALRSAREALLAEDVLDQFRLLWTALETLNPLLQRRYKLPELIPARKCSHCKEPMLTKVSSGIRYAFTGLLHLPVSDWNEVKSLRQEIIHGLTDLAELRTSVGPFLSRVRDAVVVSILDLIAVPPDRWADLQRAVLPVLPGPGVALFTTLTPAPIEIFADASRCPHFVIRLLKAERQAAVGSMPKDQEILEYRFDLKNFVGTLGPRRWRSRDFSGAYAEAGTIEWDFDVDSPRAIEAAQ
jgi:hypothetical protein